MHQVRLVSRRGMLASLACGAVGGRLLLDNRVVAGEKVERSSDSLGLQAKEGAYWLNGQRVRALGVNYFDCFTRTLAADPAESEAAFERCAAGFRELSSLGIPFVRFNAGGFYPKDWELYDRDSATYFARLERIVQLAEESGLGLIPSLFWTFFTQPGRAGEPLAAWGDPHSQTHALMRRYVSDVTGRLRNSAAVWAWEFGNEYNLEVDLPNQQQLLRKWFHPSLGMPAEPGPRDVLRSRDVGIAAEAFAAAVRATDPKRAIFTGHACPRSAAWHLEHEGSWTEDSRDEWCEAFEQQNPPAFGGLSLHFYPFHAGDGAGLKDAPGEETLAAAATVAKRTGQPLWVGEFGPSPEVEPAERLEQFLTALKWLENQRVQLAAAWVYDYAPQPGNNLTTAANRPLLEALGEASRRWKLAGKTAE